MLAAAFGLTQVLLIWPPLFQIIRWAGAVFLLWLAWEAWRGDSDPAATDGPDHRTMRGLFLRGMTGNLLNPKAAVFYVALLPTFMRPDHGSPLVQALTLGGLHLVVAVVVHALIVLGAAGASGIKGMATSRRRRTGAAPSGGSSRKRIRSPNAGITPRNLPVPSATRFTAPTSAKSFPSAAA
jgi:threonine/homoserine/homoserine lactone efflux protein